VGPSIGLDAVAKREREKNPIQGVSKIFRTGPLEPELKMVQLSATRCSCIAIL